MKFIKLLLSVIVLIFISLQANSASSNDEQQVYQQVKIATDNILAVLADRKQSKSAKSDGIFTIANTLIDFDLMAKLSIGNSAWKKLNSDQKNEYLSLFVERIRTLYLKTIFAYSQQEIIVERAEQYKSTRIAVSTYIRDNTEKIELLYKFYRNGESLWQAYDIRVEGVSIVQTQRSQFKEMLKACTIDDFLEKMKKDNELKKK